MLDRCSNPGAATPEGLHQLYKSRAATTANPYLLRQANCHSRLTTDSVVTQRIYQPPQLATTKPQQQQQQQPQQQQQQKQRAASTTFQSHPLCPIRNATVIPTSPPPTTASSTPSQIQGAVAATRIHSSFPVATTSRDAPLCGTAGARSALRILHAGDQASRPAQPPLGITLNSLDFRRSS